MANNRASQIPLTPRNYSVLAGVLSNLDASDVSIRLQLAAQVERFLDRLDKMISIKPILPERAELCCDARVRNLRGSKGHHENRTGRSPH